MSRTKRNLPKNPKAGLRHMAHHNYLKKEQKANEELIDNGFKPDNRLKGFKSRIVTNYDDLFISAIGETYRGKK